MQPAERSKQRVAKVPRGVVLFWTIVTFAYGTTVLQRMATTDELPGFPTVAGVCAVLAVWVELLDRAVGKRVTGWLAAVFLVATLIANAAFATVAIRSGRGMPLGRMLLTLLFAVLCSWKVSALRAIR